MNDILEKLRKMQAKFDRDDPLVQRGIPKNYVCVIHPRLIESLRMIFEQNPIHSKIGEMYWMQAVTGRETYIRDTAPDDSILYMSMEDFIKLYGR